MLLVFVIIIILSTLYVLYSYWFGFKRGWPWLNKLKIFNHKLWFILQLNNLLRFNFALVSISLVVYSLLLSFYGPNIYQHDEKNNVINPFKISEYAKTQLNANSNQVAYTITPTKALSNKKRYYTFLFDLTESTYYGRNAFDKSFIRSRFEDLSYPDKESLGLKQLVLLELISQLEQYRQLSGLREDIWVALGVITGERTEKEITWMKYEESPPNQPWFRFRGLHSRRGMVLEALESISSNRNRGIQYSNLSSVLDELDRLIDGEHLIDRDRLDIEKMSIVLFSDFVIDDLQEPIYERPRFDFDLDFDFILLPNGQPVNKVGEPVSRAESFVNKLRRKYSRTSTTFNISDILKDETLYNKLFDSSPSRRETLNLYYDEFTEQYAVSLDIDQIGNELVFSIQSGYKTLNSELNAAISNGENVHQFYPSENGLITDLFSYEKQHSLYIKSLSLEHLENLDLEIYSKSLQKSYSFYLKFNKKLPISIAKSLYWIGNFLSSELIFMSIMLLFWLVLHFHYRRITYATVSPEYSALDDSRPKFSVVEFNLESIRGIGKKRADALKKAGITTITSLSKLNSSELINILRSNGSSGISTKMAEDIIEQSKAEMRIESQMPPTGIGIIVQ